MSGAGRSIRTRLAVSVFLAVAVFLAVDHGLRRASFRGTFEELENSRASEALNGVERAIHALAGELSHYSESIVRTGGPSAVDCDELGLAAAFVIRRDGVEARVVRSARSARIDQDPRMSQSFTRSFPNQAWAEQHPIVRTWDGKTVPRGILPVYGGAELLLIGSSLVNVDGEEALSVAIRVVDANVLEEIARIADVRPQFFLLGHPAADPEDAQRVDEATATRMPVIASRSSIAVTVYSPLSDLTGVPVGGIKADIPIRNAELWERMERFEMLTAAGVALVFPLLLLILVQLVVTGPLGRLTSHMVKIGQSDDASLRLDSARSDEIGTLAQEFDRMLSKLERSRVLQRRSARLTGRSEIAADVVHNTGNILNSISVASSLARQNAASLDLGDLRVLHGELVRHESDIEEYIRSDPRGQHALAFLGATIEHLSTGIKSLEEEAQGVEELVEKAVEMLQSLTGNQQSGCVDEVTDLEPLLAEAALAAGAEAADVMVEYQITSSPEVHLDRQRLLEVLTSVIDNSVRAMGELPQVERALLLSIHEDSEYYRVQVTDSGVGIDPEFMPRIFESGTSAGSQSAGLGLHQASLAMNAMGGDIQVESEGVGLGTKVILRLPRTVGTEARGSEGVSVDVDQVQGLLHDGSPQAHGSVAQRAGSGDDA